MYQSVHRALYFKSKSFFSVSAYRFSILLFWYCTAKGRPIKKCLINAWVSGFPMFCTTQHRCKASDGIEEKEASSLTKVGY